MPDSNRSERFPAWVKALAGAVLAFATAALIAGLSYQICYAEQAEHGAAEYARNASHEAYKSCRIAPLAKLNQCLANAQREYELKRNDNRRDYADLVAQQRSALWTAIMGIAALIGIALSALGVWLVYSTFHETRKANKIASDTAKHQLQSYVYIDSFSLKQEILPGGGGIFKLYLVWALKNAGAIPADLVGTSITFENGETGPLRGQTRSNNFDVVEIGPSATHHHMHTEEMRWYDNNTPSALLRFTYRYRFVDEFGEDRGREFFYMGLVNRNPADNPTTISIRCVSAERDDEWRREYPIKSKAST